MREELTTFENEIWKDIEGFEKSYQISNCGRVKSLFRRENFRKISASVNEKILKTSKNGAGYPSVKLYDKNGNSTNKVVHRIVALHFIPNPENYPQVNHIDGNTSNNHVSNLEWCTNSQNTKHAYDLGLKNPKNYRGSANPCAKLTEDIVLAIRSDYSNGLFSNLQELANKYKIRKNHVGLIIHRHIWKYL